MMKGCLHHNILGCVIIEQFYFGLSRDTQQFVDAVFIGGMLRLSCNHIKTTLDAMVSNSQEWRDNEFGSHNESKGNRREKGRTNKGSNGNAMITLQSQVTEMNKLLQSMALSQLNAIGSSIKVVHQVLNLVV
ncbi:hypothetical protein Csa_014772 [Cucumis sativus]|uniref:Uncharacterized protein n=1 Tax=Cucumis sativus TaxID=3659 RepID=A0A0A0L0Y4_CUCSA|nr:hypothetical protein Csa_014772 [Cucumis sativus]